MAENISLKAFEAHQKVLDQRQACFDAGKKMSEDIINKLRELSNIQLANEERLRIAHEVQELLEQL